MSEADEAKGQAPRAKIWEAFDGRAADLPQHLFSIGAFQQEARVLEFKVGVAPLPLSGAIRRDRCQ